MSRKPKVTFEIKIKYIELFLSNQISVAEIVEILNISRRTFTEWIRKYNNGGESALNTVGKNIVYPDEIKEFAVQDYLNDKGSLADICNRYNISTRSVLRNWILKYNNHNTKSQNIGERKIMIKGRKTSYDERITIVTFCIENNYNYNLTSDKYKVSYQQVYTWVKKFENGGFKELIDNRGKSRCIDEMTDKEKLEAQIKLLKAQNKRLEMEN